MAAKRGGAGKGKAKRSAATPPPDAETPPHAALSPARIAAAAVALLDAQGVNGLTMRGLAERLGSGVMSLYWHVDSKEAVFDLALDAS